MPKVLHRYTGYNEDILRKIYLQLLPVTALNVLLPSLGVFHGPIVRLLGATDALADMANGYAMGLALSGPAAVRRFSEKTGRGEGAFWRNGENWKSSPRAVDKPPNTAL